MVIQEIPKNTFFFRLFVLPDEQVQITKKYHGYYAGGLFIFPSFGTAVILPAMSNRVTIHVSLRYTSQVI